nr:MAG TPA: hypothetical protein [Bacteriophage sp.]DAJ43590.1 MAG TPA: hypothetical protein [Bacteriophage sp.]
MESAETIRIGVGIEGEIPSIIEAHNTVSHIHSDDIVRHS